MIFKTPVLEQQYKTQIVPKLKELLDGLDGFCKTRGYAELTVTELIRQPRHNGDQHADGKAADIRAHVEGDSGKHRYDPEQLEQMRQFVDTKFPRKTWYNKYGQPLTGFYPHGLGAVFHIHLSVDE